MSTGIPIVDAPTAADVIEQVKASGSSFMLGMLAVPRPRRPAMFGLYAFCRAVDDIADGTQPAPERLAMLHTWRGYVEKLFEGHAAHPVMELLLPGVSQFGFRKADFLAIIDGMETDALTVVFCPPWAELDVYCDRVASAVGRVSVCIYGENNPHGLDLAHHLGRALQLTNILRDIDEDAARGRIYMPQEALEEAGITTASLEDILMHPAFDMAARAVARKAAHHFDQADAALEQCGKNNVKSARLMRDYYERLLYNLLQQGWDVPRLRIGLSFFEKIGLLARAWLS